MVKIVFGLFLGLIVGIGCRYFDIPLPGPPKLVGALVVLSVTLGYVGTDCLLATHAKAIGSVARAAVSVRYCGGPTGLPPSFEQKAAPLVDMPTSEEIRMHLDKGFEK